MKETIIQYLKANGEQLNAEIAKALKMPREAVKRQVSQLAAAGDVICCQVTRYLDGKAVEDVSCRLSAYVPPRAPGRKPGVKRPANSEETVA
jgi:DNA-binding Lrp family transcriptional regulator